MNGIAKKTPHCYGLAYDISEVACQHCLINDQCSQAMERQNIPTTTMEEDGVAPTDKKQLVLAVCSKFGITTTFRSKQTKTELEVTIENASSFYNLDFLLTNKDALTKLFRTKLVQEERCIQ